MIDPLSLYLHRNAGQQGPVILMYHSIIQGHDTPKWPWAISLRYFREHLDFLSANDWSTTTMAELVNSPNKWPKRTVVITFDDGYANNLKAWEELQKRNMLASWFIVSGPIGQEPCWPDDGRPAGRLLNASELRALQATGMEIGSHTVKHTRLTETNDEQLFSELTQSKNSLEDILGKEISSLAYPYGAWDKRCIEAARETGYRAACTTRTGWALRDGDPFQLRRLTIFNTDTTTSLARKLLFGSNDVSLQAISRYALERLISRIRLWTA